MNQYKIFRVVVAGIALLVGLQLFPTVLLSLPGVNGFVELQNTIKAETAARIKEAKLEVEKDPTNPMKREKYGLLLNSDQQYKEAFEQYEWNWEHGVEHNEHFYAVRLSFTISAIGRIAKEYPPALKKMGSWLEVVKANFDSEDATRASCIEYFSIMQAMERSDELLGIYDKLIERGEVGKKIQHWIGYRIKDDFFNEGRFEEYLTILDVDFAIERLEDAVNQSYESSKRYSLDTSMAPWEALIRLNHDEDAKRLLVAIFDLDSNIETINRVTIIARRVDRSDLIAYIDDVAREARTKKLEPAS